MVAARIAQLMQVAENDRDLGWVKDSANAAIALELSTIPPYLCAWWSVTDEGSPVATTIKQIVLQEMAHMGLMANLRNALGGGSAAIRAAAPRYSTHLPGRVREQLTVYLAGLSTSYLHDVLMEIEMPEHPVAALTFAPSFPTIGAFYDALSDALGTVTEPLDAARQLERPSFGLVRMRTISEAQAVIARIKGQGEGTTTSAMFEGLLAHYYCFKEIYTGHKLIQVDGKPQFKGDPIPFPGVKLMGRVPDGGWPKRDPDGQGTLQQFNDGYLEVLDGLQQAWETVSSVALTTAINNMRSLRFPAQTLMDVPLPGGAGTYGPDFLVP